MSEIIIGLKLEPLDIHSLVKERVAKIEEYNRLIEGYNRKIKGLYAEISILEAQCSHKSVVEHAYTLYGEACTITVCSDCGKLIGKRGHAND